MGAIKGIFYGVATLLTIGCLEQPALASDLWDAVAAANGRTLSENRSAKALYADHKKLNAALARLKPQRPGVVDAYVLVIGLDADPVFGREARETARVLSRRYDGLAGRSCSRRETALQTRRYPMGRLTISPSLWRLLRREWTSKRMRWCSMQPAMATATSA